MKAFQSKSFEEVEEASDVVDQEEVVGVEMDKLLK